MVNEKSLMKSSSMGDLDIKSGNDYVALVEDDDSIYYHRGPCVFLEVASGGCVVSVYDVIDEDCLFSDGSRAYVRYVSGDKNDMDCYRKVDGNREQRIFLPRNSAYGQIIGYDAFNGCSGLTSIYIPSSVSEIGNERFGHSCFYGCSSLTSITFGGSISSLPSGAPWDAPNCDVIHCKDGDYVVTT